MSLQAQPLEAIPDLTGRIAQASFPKGTLAMHLRDALGPIYQDADFAHLVLTQKNVEGKLERVNPTQEGKRLCKRNSEHLRKNLK